MRYFFLYLLLLNAVLLNAQFKVKFQPEYKVNYTHIFCYDTTDLNKKATTEVSLYAGNGYAVYRNSKYEEFEEAMANLLTQMEISRSSNKPIPPLPTVLLRTPKSERFTSLAQRNSFLKEQLLYDNYVIPDTLPAIKWSITKESKKLSGILCQKATGLCKGRNYTAWFAPSIPLPAGPWKLNGLPGIILEAYDETTEVKFIFASLEKITSTKIIESPRAYVKLSKKEWDKIRDAYEDDPQAFSARKNAEKGITTSVSIGNQQVPTPKKARKPSINNRLEKTND